MANAKATKTTLKKGDNLPARGRGNKSLILEMFRERALLNLDKRSSKDTAEKAFFHEIALSAFNLEDNNRGMCLKLLADKGWASIKPSSEIAPFDFDETASPYKQAAQVMKAASIGVLAPDVAAMYVSVIKSTIDIEVNTELKARIEEIEKSLGISSE